MILEEAHPLNRPKIPCSAFRALFAYASTAGAHETHTLPRLIHFICVWFACTKKMKENKNKPGKFHACEWCHMRCATLLYCSQYMKSLFGLFVFHLLGVSSAKQNKFTPRLEWRVPEQNKMYMINRFHRLRSFTNGKKKCRIVCIFWICGVLCAVCVCGAGVEQNAVIQYLLMVRWMTANVAGIRK